MDKEGASKGGGVEADKEIPLEYEPPSHRKSSSAHEDPSCFITDESINTSSSSVGGVIGGSLKDEGAGVEGVKRGSDNTDGSTFSSCISSFSTKEEQEEQAEGSSDPEALNAVIIVLF